MIKDLFEYIEKGAATRIALLLMVTLVVEIVLTCYIPMWKSMLFEPIKDKDVNLFYHGMIVFTTGLSALGIVQGLKIYIGSLFALEMRRGASKALFSRWNNSNEPSTQGYIQPQTDAIRMTTEFLVILGSEVFISVFIVVGLIIVNLHNPIILWGALGYSVIVSILTIVFNKPMTVRNVAWQNAEGLYTEKLTELAGAKEEYPHSKFIEVGLTYIKYQLMSMYFTLTSTGTGIISHLVPYVLLAGVYFNGHMTFGDYMAGVTTFELIVINATILTSKYTNVIRTVASWKIIKKFHADHLPTV